MITNTIYLILACVYVVSGIVIYAYFKTIYSSNGKYNDIEPDWFHVVLVFCPLINTAAMFIWLFDWPYENKKLKRNTRLKNFPSKFFNLNNKSHD